MKRLAMMSIACLCLSQVALAGEGEVKIDKKVDIAGAACDKVTWTDSTGKERSFAVIKEKDKNGQWGGCISYFSYYAGDKQRECKLGGGDLGGFGHVIMHGGNARGWANSRQDTKRITCEPIFEGLYHAIYRASMDIETSKGMIPVTVDYVVRSGRDDFVYAINFDTTAVWGLNADTRTPYIEFDWEGNGDTGGKLSGLGWAAANKQFRTTDKELSPNSTWDWTKDCLIPHVIEWKDKDAGDAEIGMIQTQTFAQHDGGANWWTDPLGKTGKDMPLNWNCTYQLNCYQGYGGKRCTWEMPYGAIGGKEYDVFGYSRKASGWPNQAYSLLCVLDKYTTAGVDAAVAEMDLSQKCKLTASAGTVATKGPGGAGRFDEVTYEPAGWNHVYAMWTVACADGSAECNLAVPSGKLNKPTFCFTGYFGEQAPAMTLNGAELKNGADAFASVDKAEHRLLVTLNKALEGDKNALAFKGPANKAFPILIKAAVKPASGWETAVSKVTVSVDVADPDDNVSAITVDLSPLGGKADTAMAGKGNGTWTVAFDTPADATTGAKTLKITAVDADKNSAQTAVGFQVKELPTKYGEGVMFDFEDGKLQGWTGTNSKVTSTDEKAHKGKYSLKIETGQWGANPTREKIDLTHAKTIKVWLFAELADGKDKCWPQLVINTKNTGQSIGPGDKGALKGGEWVECTIDLSKQKDVTTIGLQTYDAKVIYMDEFWCDAMSIGKMKPSEMTEDKPTTKPADK